jgi:hypothetical protein
LIPGLLGGQTYYVKLWTKLNGTWYSNLTSFSTATQPLPSSASAFRSTVQQWTGNVRLMTQGLTNTPIPGTLLAQEVADTGGTQAFCSDYAFTLAEELIGQRISARIRELTFDGNTYESHVSVEYYDPFLKYWITADATFGVVYWNTSTLKGMSVTDLSKAIAAKNWSAIQPYILYTTNNGEIYSHNYYMDPILLYLNPYATGVATGSQTLNSALPFMTSHTQASSAGVAGLWLFGFMKLTDSVTISDPVSGSIVLTPLSGTVYSKSIVLHSGWSFKSVPSGMQVFTINRYVYP